MGHSALSQLIPFGVAAAVTAACCPPIAKASRRLGIIDVPNERSSHTFETPRSGGIACALGVAAATIISPPRTRGEVGSRIATFALAGVGLADDKVRLPPSPRLASQIMIGALYGTAISGIRGAVIGSAVMPAIVNATNFMDGINGITATTVLTWAVNHLIQYSRPTDYHADGALPCIAAGAALGFLPYNLPTAQLFLGDSGSYLFGAAIGATIIYDLIEAPAPKIDAIVAAHAPLLFHLTDTSVTALRRAVRGATLTEPHREHLYQRIQAHGPYPHWAVTMGICVVQVATAVAANLAVTPNSLARPTTNRAPIHESKYQ